jgi:amino acid transporter
MQLAAARSDARAGTRSLGFWTAVALVIGNMIGSGVFLLPASLAPYGGISLAGWIVSAGGAVLLALVFARLAASNQRPGSYAYTRAAFGDMAGLWSTGLVSVWSSNAALAVAFVVALDPFVPTVRNHAWPRRSRCHVVAADGGQPSRCPSAGRAGCHDDTQNPALARSVSPGVSSWMLLTSASETRVRVGSRVA